MFVLLQKKRKERKFHFIESVLLPTDTLHKNKQETSYAKQHHSTPLPYCETVAFVIIVFCL